MSILSTMAASRALASGTNSACFPRRRGKHALFVPEANALEAAMVDKIDIYGVQNLRQTFAFLRGETALLPTRADLTGFFATHQTYDVDFSDVKGQGHVKRAIEVAVA